ncbi:MAG: S24/S26 family peptidase [Eubacteriales bacterium]|nr:S24/S26 family peptidase [Eubacteriales bacterium]MDD3882133.1 S24/S26 family peptidase [Eubacteriales bacterium]MDD4513238.1 S24/S26 family peptidase [Eubacteriales bacterium]
MENADRNTAESAISSALIKELESKGRLIVAPVGNSMIPLLRPGKDSVLLERCFTPLKRLDIALYQRDDGLYILHRVMSDKNGVIVFRGDGMLKSDPPVPESRAAAVLTGFYRGERFVSAQAFLYRAYSQLWCFTLLPRTIGLFLWRLRWKVKLFIRGRREKKCAR